MIIADGAAFGSQIKRVLKLISYKKNIYLYLPESFEWIILSANLFSEGKIREILEDVSKYVDSERYFSWEQFFTAILTDISKNTYLAYNKKKLNEAYIQDKVRGKILSVMKSIDI